MVYGQDLEFGRLGGKTKGREQITTAVPHPCQVFLAVAVGVKNPQAPLRRPDLDTILPQQHLQLAQRVRSLVVAQNLSCI